MKLVAVIFFSCSVLCAMDIHENGDSPCSNWSKNLVYYAKKSTCLLKHKHITSDFNTFEWDDIIRTTDGKLWQFDPEKAGFVPVSLQHVITASRIMHLHSYNFPTGLASWRLKIIKHTTTEFVHYENGQWYNTKKES